MSKIVTADNMNNDTHVEFHYESIDSFECPWCDTKQRPHFVYGAFKKDKIFILCYCESCHRTYISEYTYSYNSSDYNYHIDKYITSYPVNLKKSNFDESIKNLSQSFVNIYDQALTAESIGLNEICGMGYRKALEFLVKDYAIIKFPNDVDKIKSMELMNVIKNKINNPHITQLAEKCTWLLNDEVHYFRKFENIDIQNVKNLIQATALTIAAISIADATVSNSSSTPPTV